jgi:hypothetical protein
MDWSSNFLLSSSHLFNFLVCCFPQLLSHVLKFTFWKLSLSFQFLFLHPDFPSPPFVFFEMPLFVSYFMEPICYFSEDINGGFLPSVSSLASLWVAV